MDDCFDARIAAVAATQHGVFRRSQASSLGASRWRIESRLANGRWDELHPFVYGIAGMPDTYERRVLAAIFGSPPGAAASGRTAAALHNVPGFPRTVVEISVAKPARRTKRLEGVTMRHSTFVPDHHRKALDAIPTTTVARMLFDLCGVVHPGRAARAVDNCLSRKWVTVPALWRVLDDLAIQGRNGTTSMREILLERGGGYVAPASDLERLFLDLLHRAGLPVPAREVDLGDADQWIGRVEFVYRDEHVLIEIDSRTHHGALLDFESDRERDNRFAAEGFRVLRITREMMIKHPFEVERAIRRALRVAA